jgi:N-formylmaleamate deformylase
MRINPLVRNPHFFSKPWIIMVLALLLARSAGSAAMIAADDPRPASFRVEAHGHGRAMILIPGYASSGDTWKSTVAHFQDRYACHVLTLVGFAGVPPVETPLLARVRDDLATYIRQNQLEKPVIVGHSLGGTLALDLSARFPELVGPLVIVDALPFMAGPTFRVKTLDEAKPGIAAMRAYMLTQTREQYDQGVRSAGGFRHIVTGSDNLELLKQWSFGVRS